MKKLKPHLPRLSRPQRTVCNVLVSLLLAVCVWIVLGSPLPLKARFHLEEKSKLVGPSEILDIVSVDMENGGRARMLIAESEHGYSVYSTRILEDLVGVRSYIYREKQENVTLITPNGFGGIPERFPLILFTGRPAVRARPAAQRHHHRPVAPADGRGLRPDPAEGQFRRFAGAPA